MSDLLSTTIHLILQISVDEKILAHMVESKADFIMEVTDKTRADIQVRCGALQFYCTGGVTPQTYRVVHWSTMMVTFGC